MVSEHSATARAEAEALLRKDMPKAAINAALEAVSRAADVGDKVGEAASWILMLRARSALMKYEEALKAGEAALVLALEAGDDESKAQVLHYIGEAHITAGQYAKAMKGLTMAQGLFASLGKLSNQEATVELMVQALIGMGDSQNAVKVANDAVLRFHQIGQAMLEGKAKKIMVQALLADSDDGKAKLVAKEALVLFREAKDRNLEAGMLVELAQFNASLGKLDEAERMVMEASLIYKDLEDIMGIASTRDLLGAITDSRAALSHQAAGSEQVSVLMQRMKKAIEDFSADDFDKVMTEIYDNEHVTQEAMDQVIAPLIAKDPESVQKLLETLPSSAGIDHPEYQPLSEKQSFSPIPPRLGHDDVFFRPAKKGYPIDRRLMYLYSRWSGMGYGPNFRHGKTFYTKRPGKWDTSAGCQTQKCPPNNDTWEGVSGYLSAGILDCALMVTGTRFQNMEKAEPEDSGKAPVFDGSG
mmetsp:Transcript_97156/g.216754  ORF Transcript_97156/g.216754 Transcript_97156/m.216754 type:complete len:471 (-) Transcript_97156:62-1474(-)